MRLLSGTAIDTLNEVGYRDHFQFDIPASAWEAIAKKVAWMWPNISNVVATYLQLIHSLRPGMLPGELLVAGVCAQLTEFIEIGLDEQLRDISHYISNLLDVAATLKTVYGINLPPDIQLKLKNTTEHFLAHTELETFPQLINILYPTKLLFPNDPIPYDLEADFWLSISKWNDVSYYAHLLAEIRLIWPDHVGKFDLTDYCDPWEEITTALDNPLRLISIIWGFEVLSADQVFIDDRGINWGQPSSEISPLPTLSIFNNTK